MKIFYRSGLTDTDLTLAEVEQTKWREGFADWVYETYPNCYKRIKDLGSVYIKNLPNDFDFIDFKNPIGSLPGVCPIYKATEDKIKIFLEIQERLQREREEEIKKDEERIEKLKKDREERKQQFTILKTYRLIMPKGGEDGVDGYFDAELQLKDGQIIRMVTRNVFDFGFYVYPKRVEGTDQVFDNEDRTELEKLAEKWLREFSPFTTGIRM